MNVKEKKYLLLDLDGVCYGKHNNYSLERVFGQVSKRMTQFISEKLKIDKNKAKELQTDYFYKYNTSLRGLMVHDGISPDEFLSYVHDIDLSFMKEDNVMRNELEQLDMEKFIFTNGSAHHAENILTHLGVYDLFGRDKVFDIKDAGSVMFELQEARKACANGYIRMNAFNASYGTESCVMAFIVNRPANEPGFYLDRTETAGRFIQYTLKSYSVQANGEGKRY